LQTLINETSIKLWKKLKTGDVVALGKLYDLYVDSLFKYGLHTSNDKEYVMDCIHDLFLDLYKYRTKIAATENVEYYLFKALKRKINRKYKSKIITTADISYFTKNQSIPSFEEDMISEQNNTEKIKKLKTAFKLLTKRQKRGITLRYTENKPYEEIAEILNISVESSRTIIYRGIKVLRQHLALFLLLSSSLF